MRSLSGVRGSFRCFQRSLNRLEVLEDAAVVLEQVVEDLDLSVKVLHKR